MAKAELGKGGGGRDTINIFDISTCAPDCRFPTGSGRFRCIRYNGDAVVTVSGGITKETLPEFISVALCMKTDKIP